MVYYSGVAPYISIVNFSLILATFKQTFNLQVSAYVIVPIGILGALLVGYIDYKLLLPHRLARANKQNDIKGDVNEILRNQKLILEKLK